MSAVILLNGWLQSSLFNINVSFTWTIYTDLVWPHYQSVKFNASERMNPPEFSWWGLGTFMKNLIEGPQYLSLYAKLRSLKYRAEDLPLNRMYSVRPVTVNNFH
jgi:hypothetical protein